MYSEVRNKLFEQLNTNVTITALLDTYDVDKYMIVCDDVVDSDWGNEKTTINYYRDRQDDFSCYGDIDFTTNCRAETRAKSEDLANTIKDELHEKTIDGFMFIVTFTGTIRPSDETDNYNTVININIKQK
jgi:hypothetical protein